MVLGDAVKWFYTARETGETLRQTWQDTDERERKRIHGAGAATSGGANVMPAVLTLLFLASMGTLSVDGLRTELEEEMQRTQRPRKITGTERRKRKRAEKITNLHKLWEYMDAAHQKLNAMEDEEDTIGTTERHHEGGDPRNPKVKLGRPKKHNTYCMGHQCSNTEFAPIRCYTCQNGYCRKCAPSHQSTDFVLIGGDHSSLKHGRDGGHILCHQCGDDLDDTRVLNINAIADEWYDCEIDTVGNKTQQRLLEGPKLRNVGNERATGEDIKAAYLQRSTDRPLMSLEEVPQFTHQIPERKTVRKDAKPRRASMTQVESAMDVCPGCQKKDCLMQASECHKQYPGGWAELQRKRDHLKNLLDLQEIDQAYNYVLQHVSFEGHSDNHEERVFKAMEKDNKGQPIASVQEMRAEKQAAGCNCTFCSRATEECLRNTCGLGDDCNLPATKVHDNRGPKSCGETMYNAGLTYLCVKGQKKHATYKLDGPVGGIHVKVSRKFFMALFNIPHNTLKYP